MPDIADVAWSEHDERNSEAVPNGWPTGAFPAYTDLVGQMMMGATKRFWNKINPVYQTSGTGDNYVVQTEIGIDQINLYEILCIRIDRSNTTTTPTLQFGATNARTIVKAGPSGYIPLVAGDMFAGNSHTFWYNGAFYILVDPAIIVGGTVQPYSPNLTSWAAITRATGFDTWVASPTSANLRALMPDETGTGALVFGTGPTLSAPLLAGGTSGTTVLQASANASGTLTFPAATDTLVGRATTDTLTNKTISGASNTITNVSLTTGVTGTLPIGNGGTNATNVGTARLNFTVPVYVSTRAAMAALDPTKDPEVFLIEANRAGTFNWVSGNLSSWITRDPSQGVYVALSSDPTGATGAYVRQYSGVAYIKWWGAVGDGTTDDYAAFAAARTFFRNWPTTGLPGSLPAVNLSNYLSLGGGTYAVSQALNLDNCFGLTISGGTIVAISGTWNAGDAIFMMTNSLSGNTFNFAFTDIDFQCNGLAGAIYLYQTSIYRVQNCRAWGWGNQTFGMKFSPTGWSSSALVSGCELYPWKSYSTDLPVGSWTADGLIMEQHDSKIVDCDIAGGVNPLHISGGGVQAIGNHVYTSITGSYPVCIYVENQGPVDLIGNYIDSGVIWTRALQGLGIKGNFFLTSGAATILAPIMLEATVASQQPADLTIVGNTGRGSYTNMIAMTTSGSGSWGTIHQRVVITNNAIRNIVGSTFVHPTGTRGYVNCSVSSAVFDVNHICKIDMSHYLFWTASTVPLLCSISCTSLDSTLTADLTVKNYYYNSTTGFLYVKCASSFTGYISVAYDYSNLDFAIAAVSPP